MRLARPCIAQQSQTPAGMFAVVELNRVRLHTVGNIPLPLVTFRNLVALHRLADETGRDFRSTDTAFNLRIHPFPPLGLTFRFGLPFAFRLFLLAAFWTTPHKMLENLLGVINPMFFTTLFRLGNRREPMTAFQNFANCRHVRTHPLPSKPRPSSARECR